MTLLLSWVGRDSRKISSFYIASDSRISWDKNTKYDYGQKVFAFSNSPDILGYCGDVMYPIMTINQILDMEKNSILFPPNTNANDRSNLIYKELQSKFKEYPSSVMNSTLEIIHVSRDNEEDFICNIFKWSRLNGWSKTSKDIPSVSDKVIVLGSGKNEFFDRYLEYLKGNSGKTSRALFQGLCHTLLDIKDLQCGGAPQLVGLFNKFNGKDFGVVHKQKRYLLGRELNNSEIINNIDWRNELFERCDGSSTKILNGAQRQPNELSP
ncbi:hypothetical protein ACFFVB_08515 [Formosa undariae]|uniref:Uncharacterized protein n=1 Tax=Formosa undariae TaxID=1325436 RepID=A0ABV5F1T0_9FLAO